MIKLKNLLILREAEESQAAEEAKKRGLKHIGYGRYVDPADPKTVVAKSENGRLVRLQKPQSATSSREKRTQPIVEPTSAIRKPDTSPPEISKKSKPSGEKKEVPYFHVSTQSDIPKIPETARKYVSMRIDKLAEMTRRAKEKGEEAPDFNLCKITIPGTNLYCDKNLEISRSQMPQFKGKPKPGTKAARLPKNKHGEVDADLLFKEMLKKYGVDVEETTVPADQLKATQKELVGSKVASMAKALEKDPNIPALNEPIYVSRDGYVIDGHHRWAAITSAAIARGKPADMKVRVIDMDAKHIIPLANNFAEKMGIQTKRATSNENVCLSCVVKDILMEMAMPEVLRMLTVAFTTVVRQSDLSAIEFQNRKNSLVLHDLGSRFGNVHVVLTPYDLNKLGSDVTWRDLISFLIQHGAKKVNTWSN